MLKSNLLPFLSIIGTISLICLDNVLAADTKQNLPSDNELTIKSFARPSKDISLYPATVKPQKSIPPISRDQFMLPAEHRSRIGEHFKIQPRADNGYYPRSEISTVCYRKPIIYNKPKVVNWLKQLIYEFNSNADNEKLALTATQVEERPIWFDLRLQIFLRGRSEECHIPQLKTWRPYLECALRRNQRMEYMIPKYPLHQTGFRYHWTVDFNETKFNSLTTYRPRQPWIDFWLGG